MKRSLATEQQSLTAKVEKRLKTSEKTFKKKSSKCQYEINVEIKDKVEDAMSQVKIRTAESVEKATDILEEGIALIEKRNNHIEMADRSEFGWLTVEEYEKRELASDSDDDKRMRKAEKSAGKRKAAKKPSSSSRGKSIPVRNTYTQSADNYNSSGNYQQPFRGGRGRGGYSRNNFPFDRCFVCGQKGHWKLRCPIYNGYADSSGATGDSVN